MDTVLVIDDQKDNLEILDIHLSRQGYTVVMADDGDTALKQLESLVPSCILLDRMMPRMDGMKVLEEIRKIPALTHVPVIFQTARVTTRDVIEGLAAGARYYLKKPYTKEELLAVVRSAISDYDLYKDLVKVVEKSRCLELLSEGVFQFRTFKDGELVTQYVASICEDSNIALTVITELFINAIEHGNLGITYSEKTKLLAGGSWAEEVERRLMLPEYKDRIVVATVEKRDEIVVTIKDQGAGFDWAKYTAIDPMRMLDIHGKGIALASILSSNNVKYSENGTCVTVRLKGVTAG